jgi:hypothetical protein
MFEVSYDIYNFEYTSRAFNSYLVSGGANSDVASLKYSHLTIHWRRVAFRFTESMRCTLAVAQLVEALRYKPERRGFDSRWCHWKFSLT